MRRTGLIAIAIAATSIGAASIGTARAQGCGDWEWCRRGQALVQSLLGQPPAPSPEIIEPPADIDPQMAFAPPDPQGTMRVIRPPASADRQP